MNVCMLVWARDTEWESEVEGREGGAQIQRREGKRQGGGEGGR